MLIKALLPLIAALKYQCDGYEGRYFGRQTALVYKSCKEELNRPQSTEKVAEKAD